MEVLFCCPDRPTHHISLRLRRGRNRLLGMDAFSLGLGEVLGARGTRGVGGAKGG
jgi:hypothetical protein